MGVLYPLVDAVQEARVKGREIVTVRKGCGWNASVCVCVYVCVRAGKTRRVRRSTTLHGLGHVVPVRPGKCFGACKRRRPCA